MPEWYGPKNAGPVRAARIVLTPASKVLQPNERFQFVATVYDSNNKIIKNAPVTFSVSAGSRAEVDNQGFVTAKLAPGNYTLTARSGNVAANAIFTIPQPSVGSTPTEDVPAIGRFLFGRRARVGDDSLLVKPPEGGTELPVLQSIFVSPSPFSIREDATVQLVPTAFDNTGAEMLGVAFSYVSSAPNIATVSLRGAVSAQAPGNVTITVSSGGVTTTVQGTITAAPVVVVPPPEPVNQPPVAVINGPYSGVAGTAVQFNSAGSRDPDGNVPLTYQWTFSNGSTSTQANPLRVFNNATAGNVTLRVVDSKGALSALVTTTMSVAAAPVAPTEPTVPVEGSTVVLTAYRFDNETGVIRQRQALALPYDGPGALTPAQSQLIRITRNGAAIPRFAKHRSDKYKNGNMSTIWIEYDETFVTAGQGPQVTVELGATNDGGTLNELGYDTQFNNSADFVIGGDNRRVRLVRRIAVICNYDDAAIVRYCAPQDVSLPSDSGFTGNGERIIIAFFDRADGLVKLRSGQHYDNTGSGYPIDGNGTADFVKNGNLPATWQHLCDFRIRADAGVTFNPGTSVIGANGISIQEDRVLSAFLPRSVSLATDPNYLTRARIWMQTPTKAQIDALPADDFGNAARSIYQQSRNMTDYWWKLGGAMFGVANGYACYDPACLMYQDYMMTGDVKRWAMGRGFAGWANRYYRRQNNFGLPEQYADSGETRVDWQLAGHPESDPAQIENMAGYWEARVYRDATTRQEWIGNKDNTGRTVARAFEHQATLAQAGRKDIAFDDGNGSTLSAKQRYERLIGQLPLYLEPDGSMKPSETRFFSPTGLREEFPFQEHFVASNVIHWHDFVEDDARIRPYIMGILASHDRLYDEASGGWPYVGPYKYTSPAPDLEGFLPYLYAYAIRTEPDAVARAELKRRGDMHFKRIQGAYWTGNSGKQWAEAVRSSWTWVLARTLG